ncbi:uncharacterized protein TRIVIDRAFT_223044 [Trichoderma virens Gv29-8]|uniref:Uncharacterized protein n=1 Tax=Hypocrea virens (strain Gv29-8 / FGSC 10586) TaxID=413071 RepID=G9MVV7_HYPVG|nr:uncharacterized protein TRIVIDRAFT_223044 [Trichoderma virens Gv29-8]EHK21432.1 hypothetical protein TRIVIDRAFT_223044 [Trichoderma virens Gv29-8]UKZ53387.1 hypothetical protein TrVGV298_007179 [Trichoderma virens]
MSDHPRAPRDRLNRREKEFIRIVRSLPRPYPDPAIEWQLKLYSLLTRTKRRLDRLPIAALLSNEHLRWLRVVRGADLNVDEAEPVDLEARFFMPAPRNPLKCFLEMYSNGFLGWAMPDYCAMNGWELFDERVLPVLRVLRYYHAVINAVEKSYPDVGTNPYWFPAGFRKFNPTGLQRSTDYFWIQDFYHYRSPDVSGPDPAVPHSIVSLVDTSIDVPDDHILKSELLMGILCMRHILALRHWPGHYTLPLLILSYHDTRGRIIQMHCENGKLHIRMSRHLDLSVPKCPQDVTQIPRDGLIMTKWFLSKPIGNTAFFSPPHKDSQEEDGRQKRTHQEPGTSWPLAIPKEEHDGNAAQNQQ